MECKCAKNQRSIQPKNELIDTLWNVNNRFCHWWTKSASELIDTLWNVNCNRSNDHNKFSGINRYIMECKCFFWYIKICIVFELIDTLWNVNCKVNDDLADSYWN